MGVSLCDAGLVAFLLGWNHHGGWAIAKWRPRSTKCRSTNTADAWRRGPTARAPFRPVRIRRRLCLRLRSQPWVIGILRLPPAGAMRSASGSIRPCETSGELSANFQTT
jgi:hypothetical protein